MNEKDAAKQRRANRLPRLVVRIRYQGLWDTIYEQSRIANAAPV